MRKKIKKISEELIDEFKNFQNQSKKNIFAIGDIHGRLNPLLDILFSINFDADKDKLVFLGDFIDRGDFSKEVVFLVKKLSNTFENVIALRGNHEQMAINFVNNQEDNGIMSLWYENGGFKTINSYGIDVKVFKQAREILENNQFLEDVSWFETLPTFHEEKDFIFIHAGLNPNKSLEKQNLEDKLWSRKFIYLTHNFGKTLIVGHTPKASVKKIKNKILLDTGCGKGGHLTCLNLNNFRIFTA